MQCPKNIRCVLPDGIVIAHSLSVENEQELIFLYEVNQDQFKAKQPYRLSLELSTNPGNDEKRYQLLGYSKL